MHRRFGIMLAILLCPASAHAHDHFMDVFGARTHETGSWLQGFHVTVAKTVSDPVSTSIGVKRLSVLGDFSSSWGDDKRYISYAGGLRFTFAKAKNQKSVGFVHGLIGAAHRKADGVRDQAFLAGGGGGWEYVFSHSFAFRAQGDVLARDGDVNLRVSLGIVFRFDRD
jgi:hypothetical protein